MTLRRTVIFTLIGCLVVLGVSAWSISSGILGRQFEELETKAIHADLIRLDQALKDEAKAMERMASDYAHWNKSYEFVQQPNDDYREENLNWEGLKNLGAEHFIIVDTLGNLIDHYGANIHGQDGDTLPFPRTLFHTIDIHSALVKSGKFTSSSWIQVKDSAAYFVGLAGITDGFDSTRWNGYIFLLRRLDAQVLAQLEHRIALPLQMHVGESTLPDSLEVLDRLGSEAMPISLYLGSTFPDSRTGLLRSSGYLQTGSSGLVLFSLSRLRQMEQSGRSSLKFLFGGILFVVLIVLAVILLVLQGSVVNPLLELERRFEHICKTGDVYTRVPVQGPREIRRLSLVINGTLDQLQEGLRKLEENETEHRELSATLKQTYSFLIRLVDYLPDATFAVNAQGEVMAWNRAMEQLTGIGSDGIVGGRMERISELLYGMRRPLLLESYFHPEYGTETFPERQVDEHGGYYFEEFVARMDANRGRFLGQSATVLRDSQGTFLGALQTIRDLTDQKRAEMRLEFLSLHDPLTGLFNRTYYAEALNGLSTPENLPLGVLLLDLDGLKLVNDTLGHQHGDALILSASGILRKVFSDLSVARIGGDEFVILFTKTPEVRIRAYVEKLHAAIEDHNHGEPPLPVQLSAGYSWSDHLPSIAELVKEADARMYREKDLRRESVRLGYVSNLQRRFEELHRKEQDTTQRLANLAERFGITLQLDPEALERLKLLAHYLDIGKVGISERVMLKPGSLDADEQEEMKKQPEIGYRIAKLSRELAPIADLILKHREWWDGRGYPLGIGGEQIPYLNRLLAIVEAYVAMTGPRLRSRTRLPSEALEEIKLMSGKKLDPALVAKFGEFVAKMG